MCVGRRWPSSQASLRGWATTEDGEGWRARPCPASLLAVLTQPAGSEESRGLTPSACWVALEGQAGFPYHLLSLVLINPLSDSHCLYAPCSCRIDQNRLAPESRPGAAQRSSQVSLAVTISPFLKVVFLQHSVSQTSPKWRLKVLLKYLK